MIRSLLIVLIPAAASYAEMLPADSARGERLFESEHCIECHSVNGKGAHIAPDLGPRLDRGFTPATLASTMWNHAPTMWSAMRARNVQAISIDNQAAADLFAYFYSARFFERPGDAGRGKRLFTERSCERCHGITEVRNPAARPVSQWQSLGDPIALTAAMWNHSASMGTELLRKGMKWPQLTGQDLADLLVYLRNLAATKGLAAAFQTTAGAGGKELFEKKHCVQCHRAGESGITWRLQGKTLTDLAAQMWDHGLRMPAATMHLEPGEMREVLSYVWAAQFFESTGDAGRGKRVFAVKRCAACHDSTSSGAPSLRSGPRSFSEITMVSALWRHGPTMLSLMSDRKIPWPRFDAKEMSDLIAYLNTRQSHDKLPNQYK
jgi:mono/diheme cytochrome c family protein